MTRTEASEQSVSCVMDPGRANAMAATLSDSRRFVQGDVLPPLWHLLHFWEAEPPEALGRDGHPATGRGLVPDTGLPRRMWAAGRIVWHQPLRVGFPATRSSRAEGLTRKQGRSGPLAFVRLRHDIRQRRALCLTEWQELVYRPDPDPSDTPPEAPMAPATQSVSRPFVTDPTLLFRVSALTFNGHRIHYDADYAREVEGHAGLVVHAPLLAMALAGLAEAELGPLASFTFRATAPLICGEAAELCLHGRSLWVRAGDGRMCMQAEAAPA